MATLHQAVVDSDVEERGLVVSGVTLVWDYGSVSRASVKDNVWSFRLSNTCRCSLPLCNHTR
eukprot:1688655-Alexandrium_andersonii.AAC.1